MNPLAGRGAVLTKRITKKRSTPTQLQKGEMMSKKKVPYGLWSSPIQPEAVAQSLRFLDLRFDNESESLIWLEDRADRSVVVGSRLGDAPRDLTDIHNVRARVGYGGGDFDVLHGHLVYVESGGRLYAQELARGEAWPVTPSFGFAASPVIDPFGRWVLYVHSYEGKDCLATVDILGVRWPYRLVKGADFYMQPIVHPDGATIAWIEWDHPNMPWDGTRLLIANVDASATDISDITLLAGGEKTPIFQPAFSPDGRYLSYIQVGEEADTLVLYDIHEGIWRDLHTGWILAEPAWGQGMRRYTWSHDATAILFLRNEGGIASLWRCDVEDGAVTSIPTPSYTWMIQPTASPLSSKLALIGSSPQQSAQIAVLSLDELAAKEELQAEAHEEAAEESEEILQGADAFWISPPPARKEKEDSSTRILRRATSERFLPEMLPMALPLHWKAEDGGDLYGLYYAPSSATHHSDGLPPVILDIHGGPTSQSIAAYSSDNAFFTSRGFGILALNYRGSSGYGKAYKDALKGRWGELDVADALSAAKMLIERELADPARLVIRGGSAGGYTVLNTLCHHPGVFRAGINLFGCSNLFTLAADTHKFEARYLDSLVGPLPEAGKLYREWSPIFHVHKIQDPLAIFQGSEDSVVPLDQSATLAAALKARGIPHHYRVFEGEGHGWRKTETIITYYQDVMRFLMEYVLFS
jgi:dipeptidyl aminopeptidase/acylaminoacyl peptidase